MLIKKGYSNEYLVRPNWFARFGGWLANHTSNGAYVGMVALCGTIMGIFTMGMPLDFLIIDPHPHYIIGTIIISLTGVPLIGSYLGGIAVLFTRLTALDGRNKHYMSSVEEKYRSMSKHEKRLVGKLRDNMWTLLDNTTEFKKREQKFNEIYDHLTSNRISSMIDDSDIAEADVLLELMRERKALV